ncbi:MAG: hypothetical protein WCJ18_04495 [Planctomycetota bacterium]
MTLLIDFLCRFGWGLSLALVLTPAALVPGGFFRVNLLVVLGLSTFAALLARTAIAGQFWLLPAVAAIAAWMGSIVWLAERKRAGVIFCLVCAVLLAAATVLLPAGSPAATRLLSGLVVGLTVHAMLLGHWYLNAPGMRVDALRRLIDWALGAWGAQVALTAAAAIMAGGLVTSRGPGAGLGAGIDSATVALVSLRWLAGLVGLPILLWLSRKTLDIPNTQSATGILYVACIAAIVGELTAQLLQAA